MLPVINKIDLPSPRPEEVRKEIEDVIGIDASDSPLVSAKEGIGIGAVLDMIVDKVPPPSGDANAPLKGLIFDSYYDNYKGAVCLVRVMDGKLRAGMRIKMMASGRVYDCVEVGVFSPRPLPVAELSAGDVGYIAASIKAISETAPGDTVTDADAPCAEPCPGYKEVQPVVYSGIFPVDGSRYNDLKDALERLKLSDAALHFEPEVSAALGFGFRCGFLGLLHMEIIQERLEREYNLDLITTAPGVTYKVHRTDGTVETVTNPCNLPPQTEIAYIEEPMVAADIYTPPAYIGSIMELCQDKRGVFKDMQYLDASRVRMKYRMPLSEIVYEFFDGLKSRSRGYASLDY